jgi:hypothetical protein
MNDFYNLDHVINTDTVPWEEIKLGIAKSTKKASIFYGHDNARNNPTGLNLEQTAWYKSITDKKPLKGVDILLTAAKSWHDAWYKLGLGDHWAPTENLKHFPLLQQWISDSGIFKETGRQIIFIQMQSACTPEHVDENFDNIPEGYKKVPEFIWLTEPDGKRLFVNGKQTSNVAWFNSFRPHYTIPEDGVRWSIRIDGVFTEEFKEKIKL